MKEMLDQLIGKVDLKDLEGGSALRAALEAGAEAERFNKRRDLVKFLARLDGRFRKYDDPWVTIKLAQHIFKSNI